jgi:hypothetical protein
VRKKRSETRVAPWRAKRAVPYLTKGHLKNITPITPTLFNSFLLPKPEFEVKKSVRIQTTVYRDKLVVFYPMKPIEKIDPMYTYIKTKFSKPQTSSGNTDPEENLKRSMRRSKKQIRDLATNNPFTHFATFTFGGNKEQQLDDELVTGKMLRYLKYLRRKYPEAKYLLVPERMKSGAIHYHGLFSDIPYSEYTPAINNKKNSPYYGQQMVRRAKDGTSRPVYHMKSYAHGFHDVEPVQDPQKTANYISKYITKELCTSFNKKRYLASRNLLYPTLLDNFDPINNPDYEVISLFDNDYGSFFTLKHRTFKSLTVSITGQGQAITEGG